MVWGTPGMTNHHIPFHFQKFWYLTYLWLFLAFFGFFLLYSLLIMKAPVDRTKQQRDLKFCKKGLCRIANGYLSLFKKHLKTTSCFVLITDAVHWSSAGLFVLKLWLFTFLFRQLIKSMLEETVSFCWWINHLKVVYKFNCCTLWKYILYCCNTFDI